MSIRARRIAVLLLLLAAASILIIVARLVPPDGHDRSVSAQFIGRFHPLAVHVPIALLLLVPLLELGGLTKRWTHLRASAAFVLYLATASALAAVILGWLLAWSGGYEGPLVMRHMWGGVSLAIAGIACCFIRAWNPRAYAVALFFTVMLMVWTSDQGGKITHGEKYLTEFMPDRVRPLLGIPPPHKKDSAPPSQAAVTPASLPGSTPSTTAGNAALASFFAVRVQPILEGKCVTCHNPNKHKSNLRLDSFEQLMRGSKHGPVIKPGDPEHSELYRRITLTPDDKDFMPADGKPRLTPDEVKVIELWLSSGASNTVPVTAVQGAPPPPPKPKRALPLAPDYRPRLETITALESSLGIRLLPRSQNPTDGLVVRTISFPERCTNQTLTKLEPVADLIVDAELARTKVDDDGLAALVSFVNLRALDLSYTAVTSQGVQKLSRLQKLESLNLTATEVDDTGVAELRHKPSLKRLYLFGSHSTSTVKSTN
jgi:uncharacterized membrane protein